jgi:hypothetical protein
MGLMADDRAAFDRPPDNRAPDDVSNSDKMRRAVRSGGPAWYRGNAGDSKRLLERSRRDDTNGRDMALIDHHRENSEVLVVKISGEVDMSNVEICGDYRRSAGEGHFEPRWLLV